MFDRIVFEQMWVLSRDMVYSGKITLRFSKFLNIIHDVEKHMCFGACMFSDLKSPSIMIKQWRVVKLHLKV